ncbi:MAG: DUF2924 domain-containing protein [Opitutales bacterium]|nr:DUF2924 domain-containing protein [Opitutales bacterium]
MSPNARMQIDALEDLTVGELKDRYETLFGDTTRSRNKDFLRKRLSWRIQAIEEGALSDRARARAESIANDADLRIRAPRRVSTKVNEAISVVTPKGSIRDERLPLPGTMLKRNYKGQMIRALILENGFECQGEVYDSLSALVTRITGTRWNGFKFFGLTCKEKNNG